MFVYKKLKPSDVSITPFEAHKQYTYDSSSAGNNGITFNTAHWTSESKAHFSENNLSGNFLNHRKYFQLDKIFYRNYITDHGNLIPDVDYIDQERRLYSKTNILTIPQGLFGSRIQPTTFNLTGSFNGGSTVTEIKDDGKGNIYPSDYTLGITNWPSEKGRVVYIGPTKGFKKLDLNTDNHLGIPLVNRLNNFTLDNVYDDSYYLNQVNYNKINFNGESPLTFINTDSSGSLRLDHNNLYNFGFNEDFNISFFFKTTTNDSFRVSGSAHNDKFYFIAKSDIKTIIPTPGEGISEILLPSVSGNLQPIDVPAEDSFPYRIYYTDDIDDTGSLFFERSNGKSSAFVSTSLFFSGSEDEIIHVSVQKTGSLLQIYKNGAKVVEGNDIDPSICKDFPPTNNANLYVGSRGDIDSYLNSNISQIMIFDNALSTTQIQNVSQSIVGTPNIGNIFYDEGFITINHPSYSDILQQYSSSEAIITLNPTFGSEENHDIVKFRATESVFLVVSGANNQATSEKFSGEDGPLAHEKGASPFGVPRMGRTGHVTFFNENIVNNFNPNLIFLVNSTTNEQGEQADGFYKYTANTFTDLGTLTLNPVNEISENFSFITSSFIADNVNSVNTQPFIPSQSDTSITTVVENLGLAEYAFISTSADIINQAVVINFASASDTITLTDSFPGGSDSTLSDTPFVFGNLGIGVDNFTNGGGEYVNSSIDGLHLKATSANTTADFTGQMTSFASQTAGTAGAIFNNFTFGIGPTPLGVFPGASFGGSNGNTIVASNNYIEILLNPNLDIEGNTSNPFKFEVTGSIGTFEQLQGDRGAIPGELTVFLMIDSSGDGTGGYGTIATMFEGSISPNETFKGEALLPDSTQPPATQVGVEPVAGNRYKVKIVLDEYDSGTEPNYNFVVNNFKITSPDPGNVFTNDIVISSSIDTKRTASYKVQLNNINPNRPGAVDTNLIGLHQDGNGNDLGVRINLFKKNPTTSTHTLLTSSFYPSGSTMDSNDFEFIHLTSDTEDEKLEVYALATNANTTGSVNVGISQSFSLSGSFIVTEKSGSNVLNLNTSLGSEFTNAVFEPEIVFSNSNTPSTGAISSSLISDITAVNGANITVSNNYFIVPDTYTVPGSGSVNAVARYKLNNKISASANFTVSTSSLFTIEKLELGSGSGTSTDDFSSSLLSHNPAPRLQIFTGSELLTTFTGSNGHLLISSNEIGVVQSGSVLSLRLDVIDTGSVGVIGGFDHTGSNAAITSSTGEGFSIDNIIIKGITSSFSASALNGNFDSVGTHLLFSSSHLIGNPDFPFSTGNITSSYTFVDSENVILDEPLFTTASQTVNLIASSSTGFPIELTWLFDLNDSSILRFYSSSNEDSASLLNVIKTKGESDGNVGLTFFITDPFGTTVATSSFINSASYSGSENLIFPEITSSGAGTYFLTLKTTDSASNVINVGDGFSLEISSNMTASILGGDIPNGTIEGSQNVGGLPNAAINGDLMYLSELSASNISSVIVPKDVTTNGFISAITSNPDIQLENQLVSAIIIKPIEGSFNSGSHGLFSVPSNTSTPQEGENIIVPAKIDDFGSDDSTEINFEFQLHPGNNPLFITGGVNITASKGFNEYFIATVSQSAGSLPEPILEGNFNANNNNFNIETIISETNNFIIDEPLLLTTETPVSLSFNTTASNDYTVQFKNTHIIFEHEYQCTTDEEEYNFTQNVSVRKNKSNQAPDLADCVTGSLENSQITLFKPYVTTVGLYDDEYNLLAVGKFAQPIKMSEETDMTFVIRYDT